MRRRTTETSSDEDEDLEDDEEPSGPPRRRRGHHVRPTVRPWSPSPEGVPEAEEEEAPGGPLGFLHRPRRPVYFRARDSIYFEPLVALAIILLLLVTLYAYTQNWPPVYVIESDSMQHGQTDNLGLINTGDLVLAQKLQLSQITTYVVGLQTGYTTYGEYGDVLLYYPNGATGTPVIHRAIVYLEFNSKNATWNAPTLGGLTCGTAATDVYTVSSSPSGCGTVGMAGTLTLRGIGWQSVEVTIDLTTLTQTSGFITMGDNNYLAGTSPETGLTDQSAGISALVEPGWIVGVARGMMPWFGAVKLLLSGSASEVPMQSWEFLGLTLAGIVLVAMGLHYLLRAEGIEDPRRKLEEEEAEEGGAHDEDEEEDDSPRSGTRRWLHPLRTWRGADDDEPDEDAASARAGHSGRGGSSRTWGGRPRPAVGRKAVTKAHHRRPEKDEKSDDGL